MEDTKWIKGLAEVLQDEQIRLLAEGKDGSDYVLLWLKPLCLADKIGKNGDLTLDAGNLLLNDLSFLLGFPKEKVHAALMIYDVAGMIERDGNRVTVMCLKKNEIADGKKYGNNKAKK